MKNVKPYIIIAVLVIILTMSFAYSALASKLTLNGVAGIVNGWDVRITNVKVQSASKGCDAGIPQYTNSSVTFNSKLSKPGDEIVYLITIKNAGTIDAVLNNVIFKQKKESEDLVYSTTELSKELNAGDETTFSVKIEYNLDTNKIQKVKTNTITGIIEYVQKNGM